MEYLILSELTLPSLLWRAFLGRRTCIVTVRSLFGGPTRRLDRIAGWLESKGRVSRLLEQRPDLAPFADYGDLMRLADPFIEAEPWINDFFGFENSDRRFGRYAIPYRHAVCNTVFQRFSPAFLINGIREANPEQGIRVSGLDEIDLAYFRDRFGAEAPLSLIKTLNLHAVLNLFRFAAVTAYSALWITSRVRFFPPPPESIFLGSDFVGGTHDRILWDEIADADHQVLVVTRNKAMAEQFGGMLAGHRHCNVTDGWFSPLAAAKAFWEMLTDGFRLFRLGYALPGDFYHRLAALPHRRAVIQALFNRFRFQYFWGRDDYNTDHIIRSQELRKTGGVSLGIMHGIPSICKVAHQFRHIDYDIYYMLGQEQYDNFYCHTWPSGTRVKAIGSFGASRAELERLKEPRPKNIACFLSPSFHQVKVMEAVEALARAFPDRKVFINVKSPKYITGAFADALEDLIGRGPGNLVIDDRRSYELLFQCRYVVNESSTLTAEAIQFGLYGFALDLDDRVKSHYYRRFPDICLNSGEEAAERIRDIEAGRWDYPRHLLGSLIEMSGRVPWDVIREDLGLRPRQPGPLEHLAFVPDEPQEPAGDLSAASQ